MRRTPQRAPKKASKTVYFISGPTQTSLSWGKVVVDNIHLMSTVQFHDDLSRPNLTLCEELKMADKLDDIEGGGNHSYHLEDPLIPNFFTVFQPVRGDQCQGRRCWGGSHRQMWSKASHCTWFLSNLPETEIKQYFNMKTSFLLTNLEVWWEKDDNVKTAEKADLAKMEVLTDLFGVLTNQKICTGNYRGLYIFNQMKNLL